MLKNGIKGVLFAAVLAGALPGAELVPYPQPFMPSGAAIRKADTRYVKWNGPAFYSGTAVTLMTFPAQRHIELKSPNTKEHYGMLYIRHGDRSLGVKRGEPSEEKIAFTSPDFPGTGMSIGRSGDGKLRLVFDRAPAMAKAVLEWRLDPTALFSNRLQIDGKTILLPAAAAKKENLFKGSAKSIILFPDREEKRIDFAFPEGALIALSCDGKTGLLLRMEPLPGKTAMLCDLMPGTTLVKDASGDRPAGFVTKVDRYDFWAEDHLRLSDHQNRKNLLSNSSFEQDFAYFWFQDCIGDIAPAAWETKPIAIDSSTAFEGKKSLRMRSDTRMAGLNQTLTTHNVILTPGKYTVSFYAKTDKPGKQSLVADDHLMPPNASLWDHKTVRNKFLLTGEWTRYSQTFEIAVTQPHYFQFRADSIEPAECHIDAIQLEKGESATEYEADPVAARLVTNAPDNFFQPGETIDGKWEIITARPQVKGSVKTKLTDFFGKTLRSFTNDFTTGNDGRALVPIDLENLPSGIFVLENDFTLADGTKRYEFFRFAVMKFLKNTHKHHFLFADSYIDPFAPLQTFPEILRRYQRTGIGSRGAYADTSRRTYEELAKYGIGSSTVIMLRPDRSVFGGQLPAGTFGFTVLDNVVWYQCLENKFSRKDYAKITIPLPANEKEALQQLEDGVAEKVRLNPQVPIWLPINEADGSMPEYAIIQYSTPEKYRHYVEVELAVARGIKKGNPKAMVGNSSTSTLRDERIENIDYLLTQIGDRFRYDCFAFHVYREAPEYPDLDESYTKVIKMLEKHNYMTEPIYSPEGMHWKPYRMEGLFPVSWVATPWGPMSYDMGHEERITAAWRVRTWLIGLKHANRVKQINSGTNFWSFQMDAGLTPFANQKTSNTLGNLLGNADFVRDFRFSATTRCFLFRDEFDRPVAVLWCCDRDVDCGKKEGPSLQFADAPDVECFDMMEAPFDFKKELPLTAFPIFLRGKAGTLEAMTKALQQAELLVTDEAAVTLESKILSPEKWSLLLSNGGKHDFSGIVKTDSEKSLSLAPGEKKSLLSPLPLPLTADKLTEEKLSLTIQQKKPRPGSFSRTENFSGICARYAEIKPGRSRKIWDTLPAIPVSLLTNENKKDLGGYSATMKMAWDKENFFLLVEVKDPHFVLNPLKSVASGWCNDSLQVFFDPFADGRKLKGNGMGRDDWEYGIYLDPETRAPYAYHHHVPDNQLTEGVTGPRANTLAPRVKCLFTQTDDGYRYEVAFPAGALLPFHLAEGNAMGMSLMLNNQNESGMGKMPQARLHFGLPGAPVPNNLPGSWPLILLTK